MVILSFQKRVSYLAATIFGDAHILSAKITKVNYITGKEVIIRMPAQWTGDIVAIMHTKHITGIKLAAHLGYHPKYVSAILNGHKAPKNAEEVFRKAVAEIISQRETA
jgi:predicted urease superfamily metal-dependent hydrolase